MSSPLTDLPSSVLESTSKGKRRSSAKYADLQDHQIDSALQSQDLMIRQLQRENERMTAELARQREDDRRATASSISAAVRQIRDRDILKADGTNFRKWFRRIKELAREFMYDDSFFDRPSTDINLEKIGRAVVLNSVHSSLEDELSDLHQSFDMVTRLKARFYVVSRSAQMNLFSRLLHFNPTSHTSTASMGAELRDLVQDLSSMNVRINSDHVLGLILHCSLPDGPVKTAFTSRVEGLMYNDPAHKTPSFDSLLQVLDGCQSQFQLSQTSYSTERHEISLPTSMQVEVDSTSPVLTADRVEANAVAFDQCVICRNYGHLSYACPQKKRPFPPKNVMSIPTRQSAPYPATLPPTAGNFSAYCPIVVSPNFNPYAPNVPLHLPPHYPFPSQPPIPYRAPVASGQQTGRPADYYRPRPGPSRPAIKGNHVEVGPPAEDSERLPYIQPTANAVNVEPDVLTDTGASSHVTGERDGDDVFSWREWNENFA